MTSPAEYIGLELAAWWRARHPQAWPVGWSLREHGPPHWLRIHSLPEGRRGPDSDDDWTELWRRHREVSLTTLGDRHECWLVVGTDHDQPVPALVEGLTFARVPSDALHPRRPVDADDDPGLSFAVARCEWDVDRLVPLIAACARGELSALLATNVEPGQIYAPYEGGADLFFANFCEHDDARRRFRPWLSARPDGL